MNIIDQIRAEALRLGITAKELGFKEFEIDGDEITSPSGMVLYQAYLSDDGKTTAGSVRLRTSVSIENEGLYVACEVHQCVAIGAPVDSYLHGIVWRQNQMILAMQEIEASTKRTRK